MRFSALFFGLVGALPALLLACSGKSEPTPAVARGISWTVDGRAVTAATYQSQVSSSTIEVSGASNAGAASNGYIFLSMPKTVGTHAFGPGSAASGTYSTSTGTTAAVYYAGSVPGSGTVTGAGTIVVSELTSSNIVGTFTFTGIDRNTGAAKSISNGQFNVGL